MDANSVNATTDELREARAEADSLLATLRLIRRERDELNFEMLVDAIRPAGEEAQALVSALKEVDDVCPNFDLLADAIRPAGAEAQALVDSLKEVDDLRSA